MNLTAVELISAALFALALIHTFTAKWFDRLSCRYPQHAGLLHLLGEVEVVFGFWAVVLVVAMALIEGGASALTYVESRQYTEPLFVFAVMVVAASRPVLQAVRACIRWVAEVMPLPTPVVSVWLALALVPLLGSLITEPAAMTIAALVLAPLVFQPQVPERLKYIALGVLFVNVSIGGTLTSYAAPPVLMVAAAWQWDSAFMLVQFGWKAAVAVLINATLSTWLIRNHVQSVSSASEDKQSVPMAVTLIHIGFLAGVVMFAHHPVVFIGLLLLFLGFTQAYQRHQSPLILREALLVAFFLAGLVVLGGMQQWWLQPIVASLEPVALFLGAMALTAVTDNAALTYLGSLIEGMSNEAKYMLVAGGGLTIIANAPNPAGVALLKSGFTDESVGALGLFLGALIPTAVAALALFFL